MVGLRYPSSVPYCRVKKEGDERLLLITDSIKTNDMGFLSAKYVCIITPKNQEDR
jgi:hypothetical protein